VRPYILDVHPSSELSLFCQTPNAYWSHAHTGATALGGLPERKEAVNMADRRAGPRQGPYVPSLGGGKQPRSRNQDGTWRKKRSDADKPRKPGKGK